MATASAVETTSVPHAVNRPNMTSVGTIVWLASELMFFAGLFAMYFTIRGVRPDLWATQPLMLDRPYALTNTIILVLSSVTCQYGVFAAERLQPGRIGKVWQITKWGMREWYVLTYAMGGIFIAGQVMEYAKLVRDGLSISANAYGSVFYLTTGFHGMHVFGGLLAFLLVIGRSFTTRNFGHNDSIFAVCVSYYWHFVDVVWIGLFLVIYVLR